MMPYDIFISSRPGNGKEVARLLKESLAGKGYNVFLDLDEQNDGSQIFKAIDEAPVFIIVLTEHVLDRCFDEDDWIRKEVEYALSKGKQVVPVDPDKQFHSFPEGIPESIRSGLGQHQISILDTEHLFTESLDKIDRNRIRPIIRKKSPWKKRWPFVLGASLLALACIFFVSAPLRKDDLKEYEQAVRLFNGDGVPVNQEKAIKVFKKLGKRGNADALYSLGRYYDSQGDVEKAFKAFEQAAMKGHVASCQTMGFCYENGTGVQKDDGKALEWFLQAANAGDVFSNLYVGTKYLDGVGVEKDSETAFKYLLIAAEKGEANAMTIVAKMLMNGEGALKDPEQACRWLERAASSGNIPATCLLGMCYLYGNGVAQDVPRGIQALMDVGESGEEVACSNLVQLFLADSPAWRDPLLSLVFLDKIPKESDNYAEYAHWIRAAKRDGHLGLLNKTYDDASVRVCGIGWDAKETHVCFAVKNDDPSQFMWFCIDPKTILQAGGRTYPLLRANNISVLPDRGYLNPDQTTYFTLVFPSLPKGVDSFDILEPGESVWKFRGISLPQEWL